MVTNEVVNLTTFIVSYNKLSSSVILKVGGGPWEAQAGVA